MTKLVVALIRSIHRPRRTSSIMLAARYAISTRIMCPRNLQAHRPILMTAMGSEPQNWTPAEAQVQQAQLHRSLLDRHTEKSRAARQRFSHRLLKRFTLAEYIQSRADYS